MACSRSGKQPRPPAGAGRLTTAYSCWCRSWCCS
jgi:hypothetical protein